MKILFLYTELAGYVMSCFRALADKNTQVHVVRWPVNKEAPFEFDIPEGVTIYDRPNYTDEQLLDLVIGINPDKIIVSGWVDKGYLKVAKHFFNQVPTVLTLDNQWNGSFRQQVARLISPFYLKKHFSHAWVPGEPQAVYARKLGFGAKIQTGFYSADTASFSKVYEKKAAQTTVPQRLLYVGRYITAKGLDLLFDAFIEIQSETPSPWELWCLGAGEQYDQRPSHPQIKHHGFVQPTDMPQYLNETGVFVLPSRFEPWGVVVHEMAVAGFPMVCSSAIGATSTFLHHGENGFIFKNESKEALKTALKKVMNMDQATLKNMSLRSHELGMKHTPDIWAQIVI
ncbi:Glycosyltransferase involved in cell wall bisynthesis [Saccharicrinis carchari]|uniref:Glycosyltransferase involved in cell wall bisynthesis n=1 Tax=Saccharicrinis carchari TaxID=1168039 RepID=A0A521AKG4_SACCC|nr:glycosyltransferase family 4 protein [Saccharicrinis carchari]SMO35261.1 Glycosyltransferase involved in cell wall bisynthesis [Saccharicrinis carchari]